MSESWTPPTQKDIEDYCSENNLNVDVSRFYSYYSRWNFTYRGLPMNWKAKLKEWNKTEYKKEPSRNIKVNVDYWQTDKGKAEIGKAARELKRAMEEGRFP